MSDVGYFALYKGYLKASGNRQSYCLCMCCQDTPEEQDARDVLCIGLEDAVITEYRICKMIFEIESRAYILAKSYCAIRINEVEYAVNKRGNNIVLFDIGKDQVVDSVCYDSYFNAVKYFQREPRLQIIINNSAKENCLRIKFDES